MSRLDEFRAYRERMNARIHDADHLGINRFFNLDTAAYRDGALDERTKELLGLAASMVLRCNDCIDYHVLRCVEVGVADGELVEAFNVALVVGGSIVIPHLRHAFETLDLARAEGANETPETAGPREALYDEIAQGLETALEGSGDATAAMSTFVAVLHERLPQASWTGFYRVVAPDLLRVGPYQGPLGCLEIPFDRGVCGAAARTGQAQVVADVHAFPGHIACDARARSEIVLPSRDHTGKLVAVLDIDSHDAAAFDDVDRVGIERLLALLAPYLG